MDQNFNARIVGRRDLNEDFAIFYIELDDWQLSEFLPGQFVRLGVWGLDKDTGQEGLIRRSFSVASSPSHLVIKEGGEYRLQLDKAGALKQVELYAKRVWGGQLSEILFSLGVGDRVWVSPKPLGLLHLGRVPDTVDVILMGTATGIAPYVSMMRSVLGGSVKRRFMVVQGCRYPQELGYEEEFRSYERQFEGFTYLPVISRDRDSQKYESGYLQDVWSREVVAKYWGCRPRPEDTHVFLCGHPGMIEGMLDVLQSEGYDRWSRKNTLGQVHLEYYWRKKNPPSEGGKEDSWGY